MKTKDIKLGTPYFYDTSNYFSTTGKGVVYVLSTKIHVSKPIHRLYRDHPAYSLRVPSEILREEQSTGMLVIHFWSEPSLEARKVLGRVTYEDVATNNFELPAWVTDVAPYAKLKLVHARYLLGEWDKVHNERVESERRAKEYRADQKRQAELRIERWEAVVDAIGKLKGVERHGYYVSSFGEGKCKEIELEDMEMLIGLAKQVLPNLFENEPAV